MPFRVKRAHARPEHLDLGQGPALLRLLDPPARITGGMVTFDGTDITALDESALRPLRWQELSTVFQSSMNSLNPVLTVELLEMVLIDQSFLRFYPHELSGGMKQRVALALALALDPKLVVLDEPTTGLDVVVQRSILDSVRELQRAKGFAVLLISHDLGSVLEIADRVMVMYAGELVEVQDTPGMLTDPLHPPVLARVARQLRRSPHGDGRRDLHSRPATGSGPRPAGVPVRRPMSGGVAGVFDHAAGTGVGRGVPHGRPAEQRLRGLDFRAGGTSGRRDRGGPVGAGRAQDVHSAAKHGGGRGRGIIRTAARHGDRARGAERQRQEHDRQAADGHRTSGYGDVAVDRLRGKALRRYRKHVQLVFQDPFAALNPVRTVSQTLVRPLRNHLGLSERDARARLGALLETVGLPERFLGRYPHQLSGGQRQRVVVARALAPEPSVLVADEPISMLDVSIRAEIVELLDRLVRERDLAMLYITHDLLSARLLADEVLVLNEGAVVEDGPALRVIRDARADYTKQLLDALPNPYADRFPVQFGCTGTIARFGDFACGWGDRRHVSPETPVRGAWVRRATATYRASFGHGVIRVHRLIVCSRCIVGN